MADFDCVRLAMIRACDVFASSPYGTFNGACFSQALMSISGLEGQIDGRLVRAILCGRSDVKVLAGGSHYAMLAERER